MVTINNVTVAVINVNDVTITGFSGATSHATLGGETVAIIGTNFGPINHAVSANFSVSYGGGDGQAFDAENCIRGGTGDIGNTQLLCTTTPGAGTHP